MTSWVARVSEATQMLGSRAVYWIPVWTVRRNFTVIVKDLRRIPALPADDDLRCVCLDESHIASVAAVDATMTEAEIRRRWSEGQECLLAWMGDSLAGLRWDTLRSTYLPFLGKTLRLAEGDLHGGYAYTQPRFRGRGILPRLCLHGMHRARERGARRSISLAAVWNNATIHSCVDKLGFRMCGDVGYWNLGIARRYTATGQVRLDQEDGFHVLPSDADA